MAHASHPISKVATLPNAIFCYYTNKCSLRIATSIGDKGWQPPGKIIFLQLLPSQAHNDYNNTSKRPMSFKMVCNETEDNGHNNMSE